MRKSRYIIFILCLLSLTTEAQNMVFSFESETSSIEIKWYTQKLTYNEGVYVYRKTSSTEWVKVSGLILAKKHQISLSNLRTDSTLAEMKEALDEETITDKRHPLMTASLMLKSFESKELSKYLGIYFKDVGIDKKTNYQYKVVTAKNQLVIQSPEIVAESVAGVDPPQEIKVKKLGRRVKFTWAEETMRYYAVNIYRKTPAETRFVKHNRLPIVVSENENKIYYEDKIPQIKGRFVYKLQAIDFWGKTSVFSEEHEVVLKNMKKASPAYSFKADSVITNYALLSWKCADDSLNKGFRLYHKTKNEDEWELYTDTTLGKDIRVLKLENIPAGDHYFSMASTNEDGIPNHSNKALVAIEDITPPNQVTNLMGNILEREITLSWDKSLAPDLHSYLVYKSFSGDEYLLQSSDGITENTFSSRIDKRIKTKLYFKIVARDSSMNSSKYSEPIVIKVKDVFPPSAPVIKRVKVSDGISEMSWVKNKEPDLKGYKVRRCKAGNCQIVADDIDSESFSFKDVTLGNLGEVEYSILAVDTSGNESAYSEAFKVRTQTKKTTQEIALAVKHKKEKYKLKWNELTDLKKLYVLMEVDGKTERKELSLEENKYKYEGDADSILLKGYFKNGTIVKSNHWIKN